MRKRVGIITIHNIYNYGSIFQAYATQKIITDLGYDAELIDYRYPNAFHQRETSLFKKLKSNILSTGNKTLKNTLPGKPYSTYVNRYKEFKTKYYKLSKEYYPTVESLMNNPPDYDIFVSGSDQIWRPEFVKDDPCFFLDFVKHKKKISYASSFGCTVIPDEYKSKYSAYLKSYNHLSVRERTGVDIIKELTGRDAAVLLDPTLILKKEDWNAVMSSHDSSEPYILCYGLRDKTNYMEKLALQLQKDTGYKILRINGKFYNYFNNKINFLLDTGPAEWLSLFSNASIIIGQSFHATAFAINFEKPFIALLKGDENHDSRQKQLLSLLDLKNNHLTIGDDLLAFKKLNLNPDFNSIRQILFSERTKSLKYLNDALQN